MGEENNNNFPFEFKKLEPEVDADLRRKFTGNPCGFISVGPKGYIFPKRYKREAHLYYNFPLRPSDVFVVTFPRSGTTLTQELVWLIESNLDYEKAAATFLGERFPFLELPMLMDPDQLTQILKEKQEHAEALNALFSIPGTEKLKDAPSPRFIKTHLPLSLLPPTLLDTARVVFVVRDPRDVAVSLYHHNRLFTIHGYVGDFKTYWNYFINDLITYTPYFQFLLEVWEKRNHSNVLFLFYEELTKDLPVAIKKVAKFLEKQMTEEQVAKLADHLSIKKFKKNPAVTPQSLPDLGLVVPNEEPFIRKGKSGGWRDYFDEEMTRQAERWIADNLRGSDLRFPSMDDQ